MNNVHRHTFAAVIAYLLLIIYGSLIPFDFVPRSLAAAWEGFRHIPYLRLGIQSRADLIANFVLYVPLGYMAAVWVVGDQSRGFSRLVRMLLVMAACALVAVSVEFTQIFFRPRTVSLNDLTVELLGSAAGLMVWRLAGARLGELTRMVAGGGKAAIRAILIFYVLFYSLLCLFPFDFLVSMTEIEWKLHTYRFHVFLSHASCDSGAECFMKLGLEVLATAPIGFLLSLLLAGERLQRISPVLWLGLPLGLSLELLQFLMASGISQGASVLTRMLGVAIGLALYDWFKPAWVQGIQRSPALRPMTSAGAAALLACVAWLSWSGKGDWTGLVRGLKSMADVQFMPFYYHYFSTESEALTSLLYNAALYLLFGPLCWLRHLPMIRLAMRTRVWAAAAWGGLAAICIESGKLFYTGIHPDPTNVLIGMCAAAAGYAATEWFVQVISASKQARVEPDSGGVVKQAFLRPLTIGPALVVLIVLGSFVRAQDPVEYAVDESVLHKLPAPEKLTTPALTHFRHERPRLPAPSASDSLILKDKNPNYLVQQRRRAKGGEGDFQAATMMAYIEPGSQDLDLLFRRLMALKIEWRGHDQVKPIAVAYDWLYEQWSERQRGDLRAKLSYGCNYLIDYIRDERLSPYNVYLYNSPFQALMACSIALHGEESDDDPVMAFTQDLWKQRVLPVWRQVMGQNGGWHEGGEYVGLGIGKAVFQVPAMWRKATGEDVFASEQGLRGFLDFLIYRTRPDGTHFRWGDAAFFNRRAPDRHALALEYGHAAAYSQRPPRKLPAPTSWPWGPLSSQALYDPMAISRMPLSRHFDGLGLVVARSDWSDDATYVTFKAGDNYWSHSHLDQGAFTIYKGGALAIDSGLYGIYGSDHHMNYTYQTIAHNTLTITDPGDSVPAPAPKGEVPRSIANDGGQRRIGSGWGVEAAPLDLTEWQRKRDIYHTGEMLDVLMDDGLVVAVADVTPAYTNAISGDGLFSHRSKRVERFWRSFGYDRVDDVIVIFDQVASSRPDFIKRWQLHSLEKPEVSGQGFSLRVTASAKSGHAGGSLEGHVLLPRRAEVSVVGGKGSDFFVDGKNYDEGGKVEVQAKRRRDAEVGAWCIELSPSEPAMEDMFLVVLLPTLVADQPIHGVRLLEKNGKVGCEVTGPSRTTRWWFQPGENGAEIEVIESGARRMHVVGNSQRRM